MITNTRQHVLLIAAAILAAATAGCAVSFAPALSSATAASAPATAGAETTPAATLQSTPSAGWHPGTLAWHPVTDADSGVSATLPGPVTQERITVPDGTGTVYSPEFNRGPACTLRIVRPPDGHGVDLDSEMTAMAEYFGGRLSGPTAVTVNGHEARDSVLGKPGRPRIYARVIATSTHQIVVFVDDADPASGRALFERMVASLVVP